MSEHNHPDDIIPVPRSLLNALWIEQKISLSFAIAARDKHAEEMRKSKIDQINALLDTPKSGPEFICPSCALRKHFGPTEPAEF